MTLPVSRFVSLPPGVTEAESCVTWPRGFRASGIAAGLKRSGKPDVAVLRSDRPCVSAAVFTTNAAAAAPVRLTRGSSECGRLSAVVVNSGNANACTGKKGLGDAALMRRVAADSLALAPEEVAVCSTGIIGVPLPIDDVVAGVKKATAAVDAAGGDEFAVAIRTTDRTAKHGAVTVSLPGGEVRIGLAAKGAGMISPKMATMLCFVTTDAVIPQPALADLLQRVVDASFNRVTVDGQQSTNDTALMFANGASGVEVLGADLETFEAALRAAMLSLAIALVSDGEGATKTVRLVVDGAWDEAEAEAVARSVANSPLLKAAFFGGDPNWGRVLQAAGQVMTPGGGAGLHVDVTYGDVVLVRDGEAVAHTAAQSARLAGIMGESEVDVRLSLSRREAQAVIYFSDLSHEYVDVNSEYN